MLWERHLAAVFDSAVAWTLRQVSKRLRLAVQSPVATHWGLSLVKVSRQVGTQLSLFPVCRPVVPWCHQTLALHKKMHDLLDLCLDLAATHGAFASAWPSAAAVALLYAAALETMRKVAGHQ